MAVTPAMLAIKLGRAAPEPTSLLAQQWEMFIADAELLIEDRRERVKPAEMLDRAKLDYVIREAVAAHIKKPDDATQVTISVDEASSSRTYQSGKGRVAIDDEWWVLLGLVDVQQGAFALDTVGAATSQHVPWCNARLGAGYCSCGADIAGFPLYELDS